MCENYTYKCVSESISRGLHKSMCVCKSRVYIHACVCVYTGLCACVYVHVNCILKVNLLPCR